MPLPSFFLTWAPRRWHSLGQSIFYFPGQNCHIMIRSLIPLKCLCSLLKIARNWPVPTISHTYPGGTMFHHLKPLDDMGCRLLGNRGTPCRTVRWSLPHLVFGVMMRLKDFTDGNYPHQSHVLCVHTLHCYDYSAYKILYPAFWH